MIETKIITWIIAIFGAMTFLPLLAAQILLILKPNSQKTKDLLIGKGKDWRSNTHYKYSLAFAWADWLIIFPLFISGTIGVLNNHLLGYIIWIALGFISIYFSIIFWVLEKEYSLPDVGKFAYFTYFWGFFLYWGIGAVVYSVLQLL